MSHTLDVFSVSVGLDLLNITHCIRITHRTCIFHSGLSSVKDACCLIAVDPMFRFLHKKPSVLLALSHMLLMWLSEASPRIDLVFRSITVFGFCPYSAKYNILLWKYRMRITSVFDNLPKSCLKYALRSLLISVTTTLARQNYILSYN